MVFSGDAPGKCMISNLNFEHISNGWKVGKDFSSIVIIIINV